MVITIIQISDVTLTALLLYYIRTIRPTYRLSKRGEAVAYRLARCCSVELTSAD